jgi:arylsulfatase
MDRRQFLASLAAASPLPGRAPARPPNVIVILADDLGFSDLGCFGSEIDTPNLDRLARGGVRFTHMYNAARCCPTRAALLTGLYPHQAGVGRMVQDENLPGYRGRLNESCVTLAEVLSGAGYRTFMSGKWHVGEDPPHWPTARGFHRYYGLVSGASNYYSLDPGRRMAIDGQAAEPPDRGFYFTDAFTDHALRMLDGRPPGQPFFLYLAYTAPHWPLHALEAEIAKYRGRYRMGWDALRRERHRRMVKLGLADPRWPLPPRDARVPEWAAAPDKEWQASRMAVYAAMIDRMDQGIGRLLARLRDRGEEDDTLIMFMADNGGCAETIAPNFRNLDGKVRTTGGRLVRYGNLPSIPPGPPDTFQSYGPEWAQVSNTPFREYKTSVFEGGIASPFIAHWPAALRQRGAIVPQPGHVIDILPTVLEAAGVPYPRHYNGRAITPAEGVSLLPALRSAKVQPRPAPLFWEHFGNRAIRDGDWKLVAPGNRPWELHNLAAARSEVDDLAAKEPQRARQLEQAWNDWARRAHVLRPEAGPRTRPPEG